jgi:hippurate hydrolase
LGELNIPFEIKAYTGVIGLLKGKNPDKRVVALRADMDALPITEENDVPYKSTKPG